MAKLCVCLVCGLEGQSLACGNSRGSIWQIFVSVPGHCAKHPAWLISFHAFSSQSFLKCVQTLTWGHTFCPVPDQTINLVVQLDPSTFSECLSSGWEAHLSFLPPFVTHLGGSRDINRLLEEPMRRGSQKRSWKQLLQFNLDPRDPTALADSS